MNFIFISQIFILSIIIVLKRHRSYCHFVVNRKTKFIKLLYLNNKLFVYDINEKDMGLILKFSKIY